ncbi:Ubiquinone biosynthesis protein COQ9, mitochondrial [Amphibalanus amphitrite]|uniref:Ubiquinone biosynthesis protein n=1 Tax=Amphibalanus amphitrite TaxID=1232801 RepID=A0A6A4VK83_AMPAM|nr:Ubiquinone biosynthesis protein COQ9, mitochondrial [Amphibalanus amphitrite]
MTLLLISILSLVAHAPLRLTPVVRPSLARCLVTAAAQRCSAPPPGTARGSAVPPPPPTGRAEPPPPPPGAESELRSRVLEAAMTMVPEMGWSTEALAAGAESLGLPDVAHGLFPRGGAELVDHFYTECNARVAEEMAEKRAAEQDADPSSRLGTQAFIRWAVERRLRLVTPYLDRWPEALGLLTLPANVPTALTNFGALLDDIWYHAGDRSSDFNWYTKRAILAAVYKSTELRLLTDTSEDYAETWAFLDRRLADAVSAGRCVRQIREAAPQAGHTASVMLNTLANIAGLNSRR